MAELAGVPALIHVLHRCRSIEGVDEVCCAISDEENSDPVEALAQEHGFLTVRGSENDVLERYQMAATQTDADIVMRVTSDCPLIDPAVCGQLLDVRRGEGADYANNIDPRAWPKGLDCEVFTRHILEKAGVRAENADDREHVTPWMRREPTLRRASLPSPDPSWGKLRWTLDYPEDLQFMEAVFALLPPWPEIAGYREVMRIVQERPDIAGINAALGDS